MANDSNATEEHIGAVRHKIDEEKLQAFLKSSSPEIAVPVSIQQFGYGQSNPTYFLKDSNGKKYVLRKKPPGELLSKTAHAIEREYTVLKALQNTQVPTPKVYVLCEDNSIVGTPFYIMEFLQGRIFHDPGFPSLNAGDRQACWRSAIDTLAKLHAVDYIEVGLKNYGRPSGFYARQIKTLLGISRSQAAVRNIETNDQVGDIPHINEILRWFAENLPTDRTTIVHGDFKIDNLVFHPTECRVIGILDWELSTVGHPLSDLSNLLQPFSIPHGGPVVSFHGFKELPEGVYANLPTLSELHQQYAEKSGWDPRDAWTFGSSFAHFRELQLGMLVDRHLVKKQDCMRGLSNRWASSLGAQFKTVDQFRNYSGQFPAYLY